MDRVTKKPNPLEIKSMLESGLHPWQIAVKYNAPARMGEVWCRDAGFGKKRIRFGQGIKSVPGYERSIRSSNEIIARRIDRNLTKQSA